MDNILDYNSYIYHLHHYKQVLDDIKDYNNHHVCSNCDNNKVSSFLFVFDFIQHDYMFVLCKECLQVPNTIILEAYAALQIDTECGDLSDFVDMLQDLYDEKSCYIRPLDSDIDSDNDNDNIE